MPVVPLHLGPLHPIEQVLTLVLAFGPFAVLGVVVWLRKRSEAHEHEPDAAAVGGEDPQTTDAG